ncbi:MAG: hypothetical protein MZV63_42090 [Marinilabiliales bacterium]|nr:hypothetical protein [Marinilabiliales bacterium]
MHLDNGPYHKVDAMFSAYSPGAHFADDFYANKIAFVIALNFPPFSLDEKMQWVLTGTPKNGLMLV